MVSNIETRPVRISILLSAIVVIAIAAAYFTLRLPAVQNYLSQNITHWLGFKLSAQQISIDLNQGLAIKARDVRFPLPGGGGQLEVPSLLVGLKIGPLLEGKLAPHRITLNGLRVVLNEFPSISSRKVLPDLSPEASQSANVPNPWRYLPETLEQIRITAGILRHGSLPFEVIDLNLDLQIKSIAQRIARGSATFKLHGAEGLAQVHLAGALTPGETLGSTEFEDLRLDAAAYPLAWIPWPGFLPCESGRATGHLIFNGSMGDGIDAQGSVTVNDLQLNLQRKGRRHTYDVPRLPLEIQTSWNSGRWHILAHSPEPEIFPVAVDWLWDFTTSPRPAMDLKISGGPMSLEKFKFLYPAPVSTSWLDEQLFPILNGGTVNLREFRLQGRLDQLKQLDQPVHRHRLKLDLDVHETTIYKEQPGMPLEKVSARVLIHQGALSITNLSGGFGHSKIQQADFGISDLYAPPLKLKGSLTGLFELKDLVSQQSAPWFSTQARKLFAPLATADGVINAKTGFTILCSRPLKTSLRGTFDIGPTRLHLHALDTPIDLTGGKLVLSKAGKTEFKAQAKIANSEFNLEGSGNFGLASARPGTSPGWQTRMRGIFDLSDLLIDSHRDLLRIHWPIVGDDLEQIQGLAAVDFTIQKEAGLENPRIVWGNFSAHDLCLEWRDSPWPLDLDSGELSWATGAPARLQGSGRWGTNQWHARGTINNLEDTAERSLHLEIEGESDIPRLVATLLPNSPLRLTAPGLRDTQVTLAYSARGFSFEGAADLGRLGLEAPGWTAKFADEEARVGFQVQRTSAGDYYIPKITFQSGSSKVDLQGSLLPRPENLLGFFKVSTNPLDFKDLQLHMTALDSPLEGVLESQTTWRLGPQGFHPTGSEATIRLTELGLTLPQLPKPIQRSSLKMGLSQEGLRLASGHIQVGDSVVNLTGSFSKWKPLKGSLDISADRIHVRDILRRPPGSPNGAERLEEPPPRHRLPSWLADSELRIDIGIANLAGDHTASGPLEVGLYVNRNILELQRMVLKLKPGMLIVSGRIPDALQDELQFGGYMQIQEMPTAGLLEFLNLEPDRLAALLNLEGSFIARAPSKKRLVAGLDGNFSLELTEGTVNNSTVLLRVLDFLSLQNLMRLRMPEIGEDAFYFEKIRADIEVRKGRATTNNFILRSPVFNAAGRGEADLVQRNINFDLGAQPLGSMDSLISLIPIVGHILTGPEKALLVYYFHVSGPWRKPEVQYVPFKNMAKGLVGYFERIFTTPPRLLRKAADFTRSFLGLDQAADGNKGSQGDSPFKDFNHTPSEK